MTTYKIRPLKVAEITVPLGVVVMLGDMRTFLTAPIYMFYIEGGERKILVDAGVPVAGEDGMVHGFPVLGGGEEGVCEALAKVNLRPEDIEVLVLTHLHFDHCAAVKLFKNATIYVQKKEWETALNPVPTARAVYEQSLFKCLEKMNLVLVDGDWELVDGIRLLLLPGHSLGLQGLAVNTSQGTMVLAGDLAYGYYNICPDRTEQLDLKGNKISFTPRPDLPFAPPGIHVDLTSWFESMWKALSIATRRDLIIPGHDPEIYGKVFG